jgi:hypothetical protein
MAGPRSCFVSAYDHSSPCTVRRTVKCNMLFRFSFLWDTRDGFWVGGYRRYGTIYSPNLQRLKCFCRHTLCPISKLGVIKVKITLEQAMKDQRGSTGKAVHVDDLRHTPAALSPEKRYSSHCTGGWMDPRTGLEGCRISRYHSDSIPGPSNR